MIRFATAALAASGSSAENPIRNSTGTTDRTADTGRSVGPRWMPSAPTANARSRRSLTKKSAPNLRVSSRSRRARGRSSPPPWSLSRSWIDGAPPSRACAATSSTALGAASPGSVMTIRRSRCGDRCGAKCLLGSLAAGPLERIPFPSSLDPCAIVSFETGREDVGPVRSRYEVEVLDVSRVQRRC